MACIFNLFYKTNKIYPITCSPCETKYDTDECFICLNLLTPQALILPCGHIYHTNCILDWFDRNMNCPTCRKKFKWRETNIRMK